MKATKISAEDSRNWATASLSSDATLKDAIRSLNQSAMQIVLVVSSENTLLGTITDGDIRRGLLRGLTLDNLLTSVIRPSPLVVPPTMNRDIVLQLMQGNGLNAIPVVDAERRLVGLHLLNELLALPKRDNAMVIMAGGQGTRLRPHTEKCPKPLLPVGGKPMLEHIIERAKAEGFRRFVLAIYYLGHMIKEYFGDGQRWQVDIEYLSETSPLGTAGAISMLKPRPEMPFIVSNGDVLTDVRYGEVLDFHSRHRAAATMAVRLHEWQNPFGVVRTRGVDIIGFEEKPITRSHINAGIYALDPSVLGALNRGEYCDMPTLFRRLQEKSERTIVYPMHEPWLDVGCAVDLERAQIEYNTGTQD